MRHLAALSALLLGLTLFGCGKDDPTSPSDPAGAQAEAAAGDQSLADGDFEGANEHYKAALTKDPNNAQANIGAAITEVYLLQNDPEVTQLLGFAGSFPVRHGGLESTPSGRVKRVLGFGDTRFEPFSPVRSIGRLTTLGTEDPPMLSDIQRVIKLKVMPKLQYAEDRLNLVEANPTWRYLLLPEITEEPDTLEIDLGEVYALDAVLNAVQGWLGIAVAYEFDAGPNAPADSLLAPGTDFGTLHTDGAVQLAAARNNWIMSNTKLEAGIAFIDAETDDQSNDVIPSEAVHSPEFETWMGQFDMLQLSLANTSVTVPVDTYEGGTVNVDIRIGHFFTTPIADWKTKLPSHTFVEGEPVVGDPLTFPDPLFNGIFPTMTNEIWRQIIGPVGPPPPALIARRHR